MALAIHSSSPGIIPTSTPTSGTPVKITSASFSPPAGSLLVLFYGNSSNLDAVASFTDNLGTHLTYTKKAFVESNSSGAEIWIADVAAGGAMTVTMTLPNGTNVDASLGILVLTGAAAAASQTGQHGTATSTSAKPSVTLAGTLSGSWCFASIGNFSGTTPTIPAGQTDSFNGHTYLFNDTGQGGTQWVQGTSSTTGGGSVTINDSAPTCQFSMAALEILASGGGGGGSAAAPVVPMLMMMGVGS